MAVCGHPELYGNKFTGTETGRKKKELTWRKVSKEVGLPGKS